jgi:hypothetical protein
MYTQIHKWQQLWCPIEERYYDTEDAMRIHYREDLGFTPRTLPLAAIAAAGVVETLDQQVSAVLLHCCYCLLLSVTARLCMHAVLQ